MDSDSSDSDDEFLTSGGSRGKKVDREALVRKKLLESFYGKNADEADDDDDDDVRDRAMKNVPEVDIHGSSGDRSKRDKGAAKDLDSQYFDVKAHTLQLVMTSPVQSLLETDETLALQVRTLDSTMQTLVYENYSRFIDATDAIRNIGVNVQANEQGLQRLSRGMQIFDEKSRDVEDELGSLRDAVAEKIRVKRLLTRLDALLKLPTTLREHIADGRYRTATKSFLSATSILSKHSAGFESLKTIETECNGILLEMLEDIKGKLFHWSGQKNVESTEFDDDLEVDHLDITETSGYEQDAAAPEPPKTVKEIYECAGAIAIVVHDAKKKGQGGITAIHESVLSSVTVDDCKSMSLTASMRLLDRLFDIHHLEMQEMEFSTMALDDSVRAGFDGERSTTSALGMDRQSSQQGKNLIPTRVVEVILEAATLYGITFGKDIDETPSTTTDNSQLLDFVTAAFSTFLSQVGAILLDKILQLHRRQAEIEEQRGLVDSDPDHQEQQQAKPTADVDTDEAYEEISGALSILLHTVRGLASGLALPEIGISTDYASDLVEQAAALTDAIMRRRIDQKFCDLRLHVLQECLVPFVQRAILDGNDEKIDIHSMVQMAGVALTDCLQLVDDTVRSIISGRNVLGTSSASIDLPVLKLAIESSTNRFANWLAGILEILAGCESSDENITFEVAASSSAGALNDAETKSDDLEVQNQQVSSGEVEPSLLGEVNSQNDPVAAKLEAAVRSLLTQLDTQASVTGYSDLTLALCEMSRVAERTVIENMSQSIETHMGGGKKQKTMSGLFPTQGSSSSRRELSEKEQKTADRFRLAASRILSSYAIKRGSDAAVLLCADLTSLNGVEDIPQTPRSAAWQALEIVKLAAQDCANLFGGEQRAGPVPDVSNLSVVSNPLMQRGKSSALKGLQLDVERMFKEKVSIYPHPSVVLDFSRNEVVTILFKVLIKALQERTRCYIFSAFGYVQLLVDIEFLRHMLPHYVQEDFEVEGSNACSALSNMLTDVVGSARDRCMDEDYVESEGPLRTALSVVREFMTSDEAELLGRFVISEETNVE